MTCVQPGMDVEQIRTFLRALGILEHAELVEAGRCFPDMKSHRPARSTLPNDEMPPPLREVGAFRRSRDGPSSPEPEPDQRTQGSTHEWMRT